MATQIKLRRDTTANWALEDPVLAQGEPGYDTDTGELKIGNGSSAWTSLPTVSGSSDRITANGIDIYVNGNGTLVLPATDTELVNTAIVSSTANIQVNSNGNSWTFDSQGFISLPNGNVIDSGVANKFIMETGGDTDFEIFTIGAGPTPSTSTWTFGRDGQLTLPSGGAIQQQFTWTKVTLTTLSTPSAVIWTALYDYISGVKLTIQLEANETGDATGWHSQVCEAVIASRGYANSFGGPGGEPIMTVYGVTYTSTVPLVTFSVQRNPTTKQIEIVGTQTAACGSTPNFRIHSVEMATRD
jgi:hypothetical protein